MYVDEQAVYTPVSMFDSLTPARLGSGPYCLYAALASHTHHARFGGLPDEETRTASKEFLVARLPKAELAASIGVSAGAVDRYVGMLEEIGWLDVCPVGDSDPVYLLGLHQDDEQVFFSAVFLKELTKAITASLGEMFPDLELKDIPAKARQAARDHFWDRAAGEAKQAVQTSGASTLANKLDPAAH
jgi:hypothetical protein